ncbi:beta-ketoacyl synthase N-terminal-like domain-containing protein [Paenibacillus harenae]|uniref:Acyl transferase domain-containing protein/NAD(P)-dependent dehydrogenase (Short-subunit alcohol dehydrogenase family)/acyl carrier protein n=1 Tax=Paenibacillus harenae TaxID=306543 RepID=A0ABT9U7E1_PAEHA|nr:beta-ketoacyl synthase N-terminal-like domain-containing protein [Paenibacillus harenae]MDQ0115564.1 acyl transferase domain-containing protein/NAD(P)-dependent dehydrogenase (short-subunit alcohol dehydrogenase family)/acyl carrier protein [Paenibacillus harenae]
MSATEKRKILELIYANKISAEEGIRLMKQSGLSPAEPSLSDASRLPSPSKPFEPDSPIHQPEAPRSESGQQWEEIAIIGLSGQYPDASDVNEFWNLITNKQSAIRDIPESRWSMDSFYDPDPNAKDRSYSKKGGFIPNIDFFDPLFFSITPREAEYMDPRQRLFLQEGFKALEDAGYAEQELAGLKCGVFVGVQDGEYVVHYHGEMNGMVQMGGSNAILSARLPYFLNLKGPTVSVDTACSSSLAAIALACESLLSGSSHMAVAGGVSLLISPKLYVGLAKNGMLSTDGLCKTFDDDADGFVPGEGVGAVVLKRLSDALRDGDHIHGVIAGYSINQDGKTNGITAPSAPSQTMLARELYDRFRINPSHISYVEAHGTGTKLGDPIEVQALSEAWSHYTDKKQFCAIGSVKTNIGHALPASGIAGLTKVLLSMRHKKIAPSLHLHKENEHIDFEHSPFYVNTELRDWESDGRPRMAAISAFGFSGTNAHLVIRETMPHEQGIAAKEDRPAYLFTLAAKSKEAVERQMEKLLAWLDGEGRASDPANMAYTLHVGRSHYAYRAAFVARSLVELKIMLQTARNKGEHEGYFPPLMKTSRGKQEQALKQFGKQLLQDAVHAAESSADYREKLLALADLYVKGFDLAWKTLYGHNRHYRISLPTYPFAQESYWFEKNEWTASVSAPAREDALVSVKKLHPLIDRNTSVMKEQRFELELAGTEAFLQEQQLLGRPILTGGAIIEMIRAAGSLAEESAVCSLKGFVLAQPIAAAAPLALRTSLKLADEGMNGEVTSNKDGKRSIYAQAKLFGSNAAENKESIDVAAVRKQLQGAASAAFYPELEKNGWRIHPNQQTVISFAISEDGEEAFAQLSLPQALMTSAPAFGLHPALLDGALMAGHLLLLSVERTNKPHYLQSVESIDLFGVMQAEAYVRIQRMKDGRLHIVLADETGQPFVRLLNVKLSPVAESTEEDSPMLVVKQWREHTQTQSVDESFAAWKGSVIVLVNGETRELAQALLDGQAVDKHIISDQAVSEPALARQAAMELLGSGKTWSGVIDLSDLHTTPFAGCDPSFGKVAFLQELLKELRKEEFHILHLTRGLNPYPSVPPSLAGAAIAAFIKLLGAEYRKLNARTIDIDFLLHDAELLRKLVRTEWSAVHSQSEVLYRNGSRLLPQLVQTARSAERLAIHPDKTYVITGGTRGIGAETAKHLARKGARKLVLMGLQAYPDRSEWDRLLNDSLTDPALLRRLRTIVELEDHGASVELYTGLLTDRAKLEQFFNTIRQTGGEIGGIIHAAGITVNDNPAFIGKSIEDMNRVFEPKMSGLQVLHDVFAGDTLDFFLLYSSVSGVIPALSVGASDYAAANAFMDSFAAYQRSQGYACYQTVQWPSWKEVGMGEVKLPAYRKLGLLSHTTAEGLAMLDDVLALSEQASVMPAVVDAQKFDLNGLLYGTQDLDKAAVKADSSEKMKQPVVQKKRSGSLKQLKDLFSRELKLPLNKLDENLEFGEFGVDSILLADLVKKIEEWLGIQLDPGALLENPTLHMLSSHLDELLGAAGPGLDETAADTEEPVALVQDPASFAAAPTKMNAATEAAELIFADAEFAELQPFAQSIFSKPAAAAIREPASDQQFAIIGMACHFPGAKDKDAYWSNLVRGISSISEVPRSRWNADQLYAPEHQSGKCSSKWGGFIEGIEDWDPEYFRFSKEDAPYIDPLMRQFLEVSVQTISDAGYTKQELSGRKVGVFVGSRTGSFASLLPDMTRNSILGIGQNFIAAHASHFFNWKGPNLVVDTACSSSLVSLHLACQSLRSGESEIAIAGGVDILIDESQYLVLSEGKALSPDGLCHTFDEKANGFVPGEGCGAVMLKPLAQAQADGDRIYAVIESSAVNNDGHTMGVTTPNPEAQYQVIKEALKKNSISADTISYIEAHGTGTMIGDPIELKALTRVFREDTEDTQFCGVGAVKTNFGHLLSAAGIASVIKVALSLHHRQIPPTLNCDRPNPRFAFESSPFYVNASLHEWKQRKGVRRAGISAFGFGGTNAHVILGDLQGLTGYEPKRKPLPPVLFERKRYWLIGDEPAAESVHKSSMNGFMQLVDESE